MINEERGIYIVQQQMNKRIGTLHGALWNYIHKCYPEYKPTEYEIIFNPNEMILNISKKEKENTDTFELLNELKEFLISQKKFEAVSMLEKIKESCFN